MTLHSGNLTDDDSARRDSSAGPADAAQASLNTRTLKLKNADDLREATRGAELKIVQLAPGAFEGQVTHASIGDLSLSAGEFFPDIRARGVMNPELVTIGTMLDSSGEVQQWDYDVLPGDVVVFPRSVEQEGRFTGRSRYVTLTLSEEDLAAHAASEGALQDPAFWTQIGRFRRSPECRLWARKALAQKVAQAQQGSLPRSPEGIDFFKRTLIEALLAGIIDDMSERYEERHHRSAKLVRDVEDYMDAEAADRPLHISEICSTLSVSRRTLHRAFHDAVGVGPVAYLRLRRLSAVNRMLTSDMLPGGSVTQTALEFGFGDLGRFAGYYRRIFHESPSETHRKGRLLAGC
jgi:AraC family ethanolamine operon transcriptional activator